MRLKNPPKRKRITNIAAGIVLFAVLIVYLVIAGLYFNAYDHRVADFFAVPTKPCYLCEISGGPA